VPQTAFDNDRYVTTQIARIEERLAEFDGKLYLEFEGRMRKDHHASRVLPGYDPDAKVRVLQALGDRVEVLICVNARALQEESRERASLGVGRTADLVVLQAVDRWKALGVEAGTVVINRFDGQHAAKSLRDRLEMLGQRVFMQPEIRGFPSDLDMVVGREGWGRFPRIGTERPIVLVTGLGIESGKHTTCLSMLHRDRTLGLRSGYARWFTFPLACLPAGHPINAAFDAAGADVDNRSLVDPFHLDSTGESSTTSSREIEHFGLVRGVLERIVGDGDPMAEFLSPTDLTVNACREALLHEEAAMEASRREIVRRWYRYQEQVVLGALPGRVMERVDRVLHEQGLSVGDRTVVEPARLAAVDARERGKGHKGVYCGAAIELPDGQLVSGSNSRLLHAESAVMIRAVKALGEIPEQTELLHDEVIDRIRSMKRSVMNEPFTSLSLDETLIALSIATGVDPNARAAIEALPRLRGCEMHITHIPTPGDASGLRKVGLYYTTDGRLTFGDRGY